MIYELYIEGYQATGGSGVASFLGQSEGTDFRDAVINFSKNNPVYSINEEYLSCWGCRIFPTKEEASKTFG